MAVINVHVGSKKMALDVDDTRALLLQTGAVAKAFGMKPSDVLTKGLKFRTTAPADLDMAKTLNAQGYHDVDPDAGSNTNVVGDNSAAQTILCTHLDNSTPTCNYPVENTPPDITFP